MRFPLPLSRRTIGLLAALATVTIWTSFIVIARASVDPGRSGVLHPLDLACARILGASAVLLPVGWWLVRQDRRAGRETSSLFGFSPLPLRATAVAGVFGGLLYALLAYAGFVFAPAAHGSVLIPGSLPLWTALLALLVLGTPITPARALGLALIVGGDALVGGASLLQALQGGTVWQGDLIFVLAAMCWATYSVLARKLALDALRGTVAITVFAFFCFMPVYLLLVGTGLLSAGLLQASWGAVLFQMGFQGVGSVAIAGVTFTRMIQQFGPVRSTMITALVPGLSALGAVLLLGEPLHWNLALGLLLVSVGIVFGVRSTAAVPIRSQPA
ncbi:MAG: DMT family transporter [Rhodoferax sp.]